MYLYRDQRYRMYLTETTKLSEQFYGLCQIHQGLNSIWVTYILFPSRELNKIYCDINSSDIQYQDPSYKSNWNSLLCSHSITRSSSKFLMVMEVRESRNILRLFLGQKFLLSYLKCNFFILTEHLFLA